MKSRESRLMDSATKGTLEEGASMPSILCMVKTNPHDHFHYLRELDELELLCRTAGYDVRERLIQVRYKEAVDKVFGKGKVEELKRLVDGKGLKAAIFYNALSGKQKYNLESYLGIKVIDRYDLTLEIFEKASVDRLSKLQIRWARLAKAIPFEKLSTSMKFRVGREHPSYGSLGEYAYKGTLKSLNLQLRRIKAEIEKQAAIRLKQLEARRSMGFPIISIAGYHSAGKTSLFNALTGLKRPVGSRPFTTLSSKFSLTNPSKNGGFFLVDTIGFVHDLDPKLIEAFRVTLNDIVASDLVLLVVDISDPEEVLKLRLETCLEILKALGVDRERLILVLNKVDRLKDGEASMKLKALGGAAKALPAILISTKRHETLQDLIEAIEARLKTLRDRAPKPEAREAMEEAPILEV
ncbi:MAG: GTPase [Candidatus Bathyarchaeia archaeon]